MSTDRFRTNVSQAFWYVPQLPDSPFQKARISLREGQPEGDVSWLDELFEGGVLLPAVSRDGGPSKPLTLLVAGPPGSGKTTLTMELCYRLAKGCTYKGSDGNERKQESLFSVYVSIDQETNRLIDNTISFGYANAEDFLIDFEPDANNLKRFDIGRVAVWGKDRILQRSNPGHETLRLSDVVESSLAALSDLFARSPEPTKNQLKRLLSTSKDLASAGGQGKLRPDIVVVDSLNVVSADEREKFFEQFHAVASSASRMVVFVLDANPTGITHEMWEYACDVVIRLDNRTVNDYYVRTIEVVKARYQSHVWGKHQLKIYKKPELPGEPDRDVKLRRSHPYRVEGGTFIYPSIHFYLSRYKRKGPTLEPEFALTRPQLIGMLDEGFPEGRCTAFIGTRGGHKSHMGYLHLLHRIIDWNDRTDGTEEAALVISLRDDEKMASTTLLQILGTEFPHRGEPRSVLENLQRLDRLEILYYHPGYITPEEFFNRMFISIQRLKRGGKRKLTVMFNSLDQLSSRFPLCARQEIFVPGIIEALTGEGATSIFIAVDEKGQPAEQYGLLPMADLILSFYPHRFDFEDYYSHINETYHLDTVDRDSSAHWRARIDRLRADRLNTETEVIVLQVVRFAGGQQAGARGILELVDSNSLGLYNSAGLKFTKLSERHGPGIPVAKIAPF